MPAFHWSRTPRGTSSLVIVACALATVDVEDLAGDRRAFQMKDRVDDVFDLTDLTDRVQLRQGLVRTPRRIGVRMMPSATALARIPRSTALDCQRFGHRVESTLGQ
jgi:hypothetical protein